MPSTRSTPVPLPYRAFGSGAWLVILHGLFGCWHNRYPVARALAGRFRVLAVDPRNHGDSGHTAPLDYEHPADDVRTFPEGPG